MSCCAAQMRASVSASFSCIHPWTTGETMPLSTVCFSISSNSQWPKEMSMVSWSSTLYYSRNEILKRHVLVQQNQVHNFVVDDICGNKFQPVSLDSSLNIKQQNMTFKHVHYFQTKLNMHKSCSHCFVFFKFNYNTLHWILKLTEVNPRFIYF